jgi:hypothetical protein
VAQAMNRRGLGTALGAAVALVYLVAMVVAGALPEQKQLVKFEARGVMKLQPGQITRVELQQGPGKAVLVRKTGGWAIENGPDVPAELSGKISMGVQFMNTAGPLRVMDSPEIQGSNPRDFGLELPRVRFTLFQNGQPVIGARFGSHNIEDTAQYMMIEGQPELYMMSRFVGQEWEAVAAAIFSRPPVSAAPSRP